MPFTTHRNHYSSSGGAVLTHVSLPKWLFYALSHTSSIMKTRAKNWILRPYLVSPCWTEEESTILVTDTFCVLTSVIGDCTVCLLFSELDAAILDKMLEGRSVRAAWQSAHCRPYFNCLHKCIFSPISIFLAVSDEIRYRRPPYIVVE